MPDENTQSLGGNNFADDSLNDLSTRRLYVPKLDLADVADADGLNDAADSDIAAKSVTESLGDWPEVTGDVVSQATTDVLPPLPARQSSPVANQISSSPVPPIAGGEDPMDMSALSVRKKSKLPWIIMAIVLGVLLVAAIAGFFTARWYYGDKVAPGVTFGGANVSGQTADQLKDTVETAVKGTTVKIKDDDGNNVSATLDDLGVSYNVDKTVSNLLAAKRDAGGVFGYINEVNPLSKRNVSLAAKTNMLTLKTFVTSKFVQDGDRAVPSTAAYDANAQAFVAIEGHGGRSAKSDKVIATVNEAINNPGHEIDTTISYEKIEVPIALSEAQSVADQANARLSAAIVFDNGQGKNFQIPIETVASWMKPDADLEKGKMALSYDENAINTFVQQQVPVQLNQEAVDQEDVVDGNGTVLDTVVKGVNGVKVKNVGSLTPKVVEALKNGQGATIPVEGDVQNFKTVQKKSEYRVVVDRSAQTATVYRNGEAVKTFPVCTGTPGNHQTDLGIYFVYLKYQIQDMTGLNDDGSRYLSKGVKWVSYFNGGEGFHTASWNNYGIAHGDPVHYGSHGCVNMYEADSKWIYDNCPEGTIVQVIGDMPSGAVR